MSKATKKTKPKKQDPRRVIVERWPDEDKGLATARTFLRPSVQAAKTLREFHKSYVDTDIPSLVEELSNQIKAVEKNDMKRSEAMLVTQAHTLDAIFNSLACYSNNAKFMDQFESYLKLALRAQSQCRSTLEALASIKNPPMMGYVKQTNIAHGHQQVNNVPANGTKSSAEENEKPQNQLLEVNHGERLDTGAAGQTGKTNKEMATVGTGDGSKNGRG
jgi:hypothetical protein